MVVFQINDKQLEFENTLSVVEVKKEIIKQSFIFLLERESNTSILRKFDIEVIANYFPEYKKLFK